MEQDDQNNRILAAAKEARIYESIDTKSALDNTKEKLGLLTNDHKVGGIGFNSMLRIAASIIVAIGIGFAIYMNQSNPGWTEVASGESIKEYKLPDGSVVTLNRNSILQIKRNMKNQRIVALDGEAFFDVSRDEKRPFIITSGKVKVEVLGTSFNIQSDLERTEVTVATGKVQVSEYGDITNQEILIENESVVYENMANALIKSTIDPNYLTWKTGIFTFRNTSAQQAIQQLADHHKVQIEFQNIDELKNCTITSVFDNQSWVDIIQEISLIHSFEFNLQNGTTFISGGNCK
ncbi:MAG: FecR domain-containing protein [Cyclobacteriaceae bacterium]